MPYPMLQFVDSISSTAALRYDFNQSTAGLRTLPLGGDSLNLGVPSWSGDPGGVGGFYGYRSMSLTQRIIGSKATAMAQMSALARELVRPENFLRYKQDPGRSPVYFKTYRTDPGELSLEFTESSDAWDIQVPLIAEPFAYGERQTISSATITHALTGTNPMKLVLPAIKGDAPTALRVTMTPVTAAGSATDWLIGCCSGDSTLADLMVDIGTGDVFTAGTNTAAGVANATDFGGSCRTVTVTPNDNVAGSNFSTRLTGNVTLPTAGRWKALLRYEAESGSLGQTRNYTFSLLNFDTHGLDVPTPVATVTATGNGVLDVEQGWLELGEFTAPFGFNAPADVTGPMTAQQIRLKVGEASNLAGVVRLDALRFVPVSGRAVSSVELLKAGGLILSTTARMSLDGDYETVYANTISTGAHRAVQSELAGAFPTADPAAAVNLLIVQAIHAQSTTAHNAVQSTSAGFQVTVDVSYHPRYLHIGDGT